MENPFLVTACLVHDGRWYPFYLEPLSPYLNIPSPPASRPKSDAHSRRAAVNACSILSMYTVEFARIISRIPVASIATVTV